LNHKIVSHAKSGWFSDFDVFELDVSLSKLVDKNANEEEILKIMSATLLTSLKAGPRWMLNPTMYEIIESSEQMGPEDSIISFLKKYSDSLKIEEIDIRKKHAKIFFRARIICKNVIDFLSISKDIKVENGYVQTALFKFPLR
jgi:hypothetical protein